MTVAGFVFALIASANVASVAASPDSVQILSFADFYRSVATNHPVVRQARLLVDGASADVTQARGAFDPVFSAGWQRKRFDGSSYYDYRDAAIKFPTSLGFDLKIGYEKSEGKYIAPDRRTPSTGLVTAGISLPLGPRLFVDERRTNVAAARASYDMAIAEREASINKLLLSSAKLYGAWYESHRRLQLTTRGINFAEERLRATRSRVAAGDAASIDTIEASLEVQKRRVMQQEADVDYRNARLALEAFLWEANGTSATLPPNAEPSDVGLEPRDVDSSMVDGWLASVERDHPNIRKARAKLDVLGASRRLAAAERLSPSLEFSVDALGEGEVVRRRDLAAFDNDDNAKAGASLKIPLIFRKERGKFRAADAKVEQQQLELSLARREVMLAVRAAANELRALHAVQRLQERTVQQALTLRNAEQRKFEMGESTLFLVNARERALLDEEVKLISLRAKYASARAALAVALGEPGRLPGE